MKSKIFIVRHTETIGNIENRLTGRQDYEVTDNGKILIKKLMQNLKNIKFDKVYASTSGRAEKTIEQLAKLNGLEIEQKEELCEMYFGIYDGWKWEDVNRVQPEIKQTQNEINEISGIPKQETTEEVAERMYNCILEIARQSEGKTILIGSHGVAIEAFLRKIANVPFGYEREKFCQHNVAINELDFEDNRFNIIQLANISYLQEGKNEKGIENMELAR